MSLNSFRVKSRLFLTLLTIAPCLTGCWDRLEVEQRAAVLGIAVDTADTEMTDGQNVPEMQESDATLASEVAKNTKSGLIRLSAQIAVPGRIPLGPGEGGGGGGTPEKTVWVVHSIGTTLDDALMQLQQKVADKLFLGHLRVIVVSEKFAREEGLRSVTDTLRRNPEVRRTAWLVVSKGPADTLMEASPPLERVPTLYLLATMDHARQMGKLGNEFFGVFASRMTMKGREPVLPYLDALGNENISVNGLAFFKGDKMADTTRKTFDISTYMEFCGTNPGGYAIMLQIPGQTGTFMWQAYRRSRKIDVQIVNGLPHFTAHVHIDGNVREKSGDQVSLDDPQVLQQIDSVLVKRGDAQLKKFIEQTKQSGTDIIGFGEYLRAKRPGYWDRYIQTKKKWEEMYPKITVDVHLHIRTHRVGMQEK